MFKTQKPHVLPLPFKSRREEVARQKQERDQFFVARALEQAEGFSWSQNTAKRSLWQQLQALPLVNKLAAVGAVGIALLIIFSFIGISSIGIEPKQQIIYVESWSSGRTADDARADREAAVAQARAEQAAFEAQVKAAQEEQARQAAARQAAAGAARPA
jgi:hypothetical protein